MRLRQNIISFKATFINATFINATFKNGAFINATRIKATYIVVICVLCAACGAQTENSEAANSSKTRTSAPGDFEPRGFINTADPQSNRVALLIEIAKIRAKIDAYHTSRSLFTSDTTPEQIADWQSMLSRSVNQTTVDAYATIEALLKAPEAAEIADGLTQLASPESIQTASNNSRENRDGIRLEYEKARGVEERLRAASDQIYPTRKEYFLVASALLRFGGDHAKKAIASDGSVIDLYELLLAAAFNHIADKSHPRWIAYCDGQRAPLEKLDKGIDFISSEAAANKLGVVVKVNPSHFYQHAAVAQAIANTLPNTDKAICE